MAVETAAAGASGTTTSNASPVPAKNWGWIMVRGVLTLALGVAALIFPLSAIFAFTLLFAAFAFVDGVAALISGIAGARKGERWGALVFQGVLGILVGVLFVLMPLIATVTYAYLTVALLAAWSLFTGVLEIWAAIRLRKEMEGEWLLGLSGAISILLGIGVVALLMPLPAVTILSAAWLIAIFAFASGMVLVAQALRLKRRRRLADDRSAHGARIAGELGDGATVGCADRNPRDAAPAGSREFLGFGDERLTLACAAEEDHRSLGGHRLLVATVADIGEGGVGEGEHHPAVDDPVTVEHVGANLHREARVARARLLDHDAPGGAGAFGGEHRVGDLRGEFVGVHGRPLPSC